MTAIAWVLLVAFGLMSGLAWHFHDQRDSLIEWTVEKHPEDLE